MLTDEEVSIINGEGNVTVTLDEASIWTLTGDSSINVLNGSKDQVNLNGFELTIMQ